MGRSSTAQELKRCSKMHLILFLGCLLGSSAQSSRDEVLQWWDKMSVQKPVKCQLNPELLQDFHPVAQKYLHVPENFIRPRLCGQKEIRDYKSKGLKINNGTIEGTGKIIFLKAKAAQYEESLREDKHEITYCLSRSYFDDKEVIEIIGTFENGLLIGPVKLKLGDGTTSIANFIKGVPRGLYRIWDKEGQLLKIFYKDIQLKGFQWGMVNKYLVYNYNPLVKDEDISSVAIPKNESEPVLVGDYNYALSLLDNIYSADIEVGSKDLCLLNLSWKPKAKQDYKLFLPGAIKTPLVYQTEPNCNGNGAQEKSTPEEQFKSWHNYMADFQEFTNQPALNVFHMKPELEPVTINEPFIGYYALGSSNSTLGVINYVNMSVWNGP